MFAFGNNNKTVWSSPSWQTPKCMVTGRGKAKKKKVKIWVKNITSILNVVMGCAENTRLLLRGSNTVWLTSCLTCLDLAKRVNLPLIQHKQIMCIKTGGQSYNDISPCEVSLCPLSVEQLGSTNAKCRHKRCRWSGLRYTEIVLSLNVGSGFAFTKFKLNEKILLRLQLVGIFEAKRVLLWNVRLAYVLKIKC